MDLQFKHLTFDEALAQYNTKELLIPTPEKTGIFTNSPYNGTGDFRWLKNQDQLYDFLLNAWLPTQYEEQDDNYYMVMAQTRKLLEETKGDMASTKAIVEDLPFVEDTIEWVGKPADLLQCPSLFASQLRTQFNGDDPITDEEWDDFLEFLKMYVAA